jgi:two-component system chemotaxis sensor kinase CheA
VPTIGQCLLDSGKITIEQLNEALEKTGPALLGEVLIHEGAITLSDVSEARAKQTSAQPKKAAATADLSVRVRTDRLDRLIDIVGELVIAQSMLAQDSTVQQGIHHDLSRKISHAGKIVRELQDLSMGMRMIPLRNTFQKMARLVRDLAQKIGKQVEFVTDGEDTEIDRNMVDLIADPLVHMVRNAIDHGIELPADREKAGKNRVGRVRLAAYNSGGDVVVELTDDGAGIDRDVIVAKAISKNLIETDKGMSETEIFNLIFAPGFSTAAQVTDVSGRGVGMDVVRRNIEAMRGRVVIGSEKSKGSTFTVRLPLTLAITDGMLIRVGTERFIIPIVNIQLSFQPNPNMLSSVTGKGELVSLRGELMPIIRLHRVFSVMGAKENPTEGLLMIVADGRRRCALLVDELLGQQQVVAKNLGKGMGKIPGVSGGAILGDGCIGLILDTPELVALARQNTSADIRVDESRMERPQLLAA